MAKKGTSPIALCMRKVLDPKSPRFDNNCGRSIENIVRKGQKGKKISHIMATGSQNRYTMATKDSPVSIFSAKDDLERFWSHFFFVNILFHARAGLLTEKTGGFDHFLLPS